MDWDGCGTILVILLVLAALVFVGYLLREWILIGILILFGVAFLYNAGS